MSPKQPLIFIVTFLGYFSALGRTEFALVDFTNATLTEDGLKECVNTTGVIEVYEKVPVYECIHKEEEQCHYTYVTQFLPSRQRECDQYYEKSCKVTYNKVATNETHEYCYEPLVRQCDGEPAGRTVCKDWPETFCSSKYVKEKTNEGQFISDTSCQRVETRVCVPVNCAMVPGKPQCHDKVVAVVNEVPEENCELIPYDNCVFKTKLVPKLKAVPVCTLVPREICQVNYVRGKEKVRKEVLSIWCRLSNSTISDDEEEIIQEEIIQEETTLASLSEEQETTTQEYVAPTEVPLLQVDYDLQFEDYPDSIQATTMTNQDIDEDYVTLPTYVGNDSNQEDKDENQQFEDLDLPSYTNLPTYAIVPPVDGYLPFLEEPEEDIFTTEKSNFLEPPSSNYLVPTESIIEPNEDLGQELLPPPKPEEEESFPQPEYIPPEFVFETPEAFELPGYGQSQGNPMKGGESYLPRSGVDFHTPIFREQYNNKGYNDLDSSDYIDQSVVRKGN